MLYSGNEQTPRMGDPAPAPFPERRTFTRRIDCAERARAPHALAAADPHGRERRAAPRGGRRMDID